MSVLIVGDIGISHNGSVETAIELIDRAARCGFDAVKFQKRNPELYPERPYTSPVFGETTYREHKRQLELSASDYSWIGARCEAAGIAWFASCFDEESVDFISQFKTGYWKIASPCITNLDLVDYIAQQSGHVIMSTGMCTLEELNRAVTVLLARRTYDQFDLLHCCSEYPTPLEHVNLNVMEWMIGTYPCKIGYSSHDGGLVVPVTAAGLGAQIIEVHITLDRMMPGSDHAASLEYVGMETLVRHIRAVEKALGSCEKQFYDGERKIRDKVSQCKNTER